LKVLNLFLSRQPRIFSALAFYRSPNKILPQTMPQASANNIKNIEQPTQAILAYVIFLILLEAFPVAASH
jgi:hypothetical protein